MRRRAGRARVVVILGALSAFGPLSIDMYLPGLPELGATLDAPAWAVQLTLTACVAGLALGQLVAGPLSDRFGRRRPLIAGVAAYAVGLAAVRPRADRVRAGRAAARPGAGGRGGHRDRPGDRARHALGRRGRAAVLAADARHRPRADPRAGDRRPDAARDDVARHVRGAGGARRRARGRGGGRPARDARRPRTATPGGVAETLRDLPRLLARPRRSSATRWPAASRSARCSPTSPGSSFVLQDIYGASPQLFSVMFAANGLGLVAGSQVNARCCGGLDPRAAAARRRSACRRAPRVALLAAVAAGAGVWPIVVLLFVVVASVGFVFPNATALALADHPRVAGSASALLGVLQFIVGAAAAPLVGVGGTGQRGPDGDGDRRPRRRRPRLRDARRRGPGAGTAAGADGAVARRGAGVLRRRSGGAPCAGARFAGARRLGEPRRRGRGLGVGGAQRAMGGILGWGEKETRGVRNSPHAAPPAPTGAAGGRPDSPRRAVRERRAAPSVSLRRRVRVGKRSGRHAPPPAVGRGRRTAAAREWDSALVTSSACVRMRDDFSPVFGDFSSRDGSRLRVGRERDAWASASRPRQRPAAAPGRPPAPVPLPPRRAVRRAPRAAVAMARGAVRAAPPSRGPDLSTPACLFRPAGRPAGPR